jgi:hypothetical protein
VQIAVALGDDGRLMARQGEGTPFELVPTGTNLFTPTIDAPLVRFERTGSGAVTALVVGNTRLERQP